jgi:3,4-dihydroxy 2-butanone 4-phosphate synthase/GTP cyclohydrolase II
LDIISKEGKGVILYLRHKRSGWEMVDWLRYLAKVQAGEDIPDELGKAEEASKHRDYGTGAQILRDLGLNKIRLITDSDFKMVGLKAYGIEIIERIPIERDIPEDEAQMRRNYGDLETRTGH